MYYLFYSVGALFIKSQGRHLSIEIIGEQIFLVGWCIGEDGISSDPYICDTTPVNRSIMLHGENLQSTERNSPVFPQPQKKL